MQIQQKLQDGDFAFSRGLFDTAKAAYSKALELSLVAKDDGLCAESRRALARTLGAFREYDQMAQMAMDAYADDSNFWGPQSELAAADLFLAADAYSHLGDFARAKQLFEECLSIRQMYYDKERQEIVAVFIELLRMSVHAPEIVDPIPLHEMFLPTYKNYSGGENWANFIKLNETVEKLIKEEQQTEAEEFIKRELTLLEQNFRHYPEEIRLISTVYKDQLYKSKKALASWQMKMKEQPQGSPSKFIAQAQRLAATGKSDDAARAYEIAMRQLEAEHGSADANALEARRQYLLNLKTKNQQEQGLGKHISAVQRLSLSKSLRAEIPQFLDKLILNVSMGLPYQQAIAEICQNPVGCSTIAKELQKAVDEFKLFRKPISDSIRDLGESYEVAELSELGASLAMAERSGGSISAQLKEQCMALRERIKSERQGANGMLRAFKWF